jgi:PPOX class probable F420-dependent enzyme
LFRVRDHGAVAHDCAPARRTATAAATVVCRGWLLVGLGLVDEVECRRRFVSSAVARLATVRPDGGPHVVPVVFAVVNQVVYTAVDAKRKRTQKLQRLANLRRDARCCLLVDHYQDDWSGLWWVRADGRGSVVDDPPSGHPGLVALGDRYPQYRNTPPDGPLLAVTVDRWSGWSAA